MINSSRPHCSHLQGNSDIHDRCRRASIEAVQDLWPLGTHLSCPQLQPVRSTRKHSCTQCITQTQAESPKQRTASMKAQPQNARSRYLCTISTMEKVSIDLLTCSSTTETKWLWLPNAGDMAARARSGITLPQNLPGEPVQVVELLAKVSQSERKRWKADD